MVHGLFWKPEVNIKSLSSLKLRLSKSATVHQCRRINVGNENVAKGGGGEWTIVPRGNDATQSI